MALSANLLQTFQSIVGDKGFFTDADSLAPYLVESRNSFQGACDVLLKPQKSEEVSQILATCNEEDIPVVPQGGNTGHCGGAVPNGGVLLNLERMNKITAVNALNGTITCEAGCILADIQKAALEHDLYFPLSLASEGSCQIGGNLATNAGGVHVVRYGNMRALTLGLEVCLADGQIIENLRPLRKNNTGLDLKQLFIGTEGTLGIITKACLSLKAKPVQTECAFFAVDDPESLLESFKVLRAHFEENLSAFEIMPHFALEIVQTHMTGQKNPLSHAHPWYALVDVSSSRVNGALRTAFETVLSQLMDSQVINECLIAESLAQRHHLWNIRESIPEAQKREGASIKHDISVPLAHIPDFMKEAKMMLENQLPGLRFCTFGHMGDGNLHFNITQPEDMSREKFLSYRKDFNDIIHQLADHYDGSFSAEHGIGLLKTAEMEFYLSDSALELMKSLKRTMDPNNILNPGKVIRL